MKNDGFNWMLRISAVLALTIATGALAQAPKHTKYSGTLNDFTPANVSGPWEVRGHWSLRVNNDAGTADFSAALTMARTDAGVTTSGTGDLNDPKQRNAHTHHITLVAGLVGPIPGNPNGFRVTGAATITGNGAYPPPFGAGATLQIDVTGGNTVTFSNIAVTFEDPAAPATGKPAEHFGMNPLHGVVSAVHKSDADDDGGH